jgi:bifunctional DNA-binding transcriptional regulator/antitoxin component of YhaV-PrlF toxin-antitoxin module
MGYPTKMQLINRKASQQWYVNMPAAVAEAMEFKKGEVVEWIVDDQQHLVLKRDSDLVASLKKKLPKTR